jgi:hypothetical protein
LAASLRLERGARLQRHSAEAEDLPPHRVGENRVPVADNGGQNAMKPDNLLEEGRRDRRCSIWVTQGNEVGVLGQAIDHCQNHCLAADLQEIVNEIHGDVLPHHGWHIEGLKETRLMEVLYLVALTDRAALNELTKPVCVVRHEGGAQPVECLLNAFMAQAMGVLEHGHLAAGGRWQKNVSPKEDDIVDDGPARAGCIGRDFGMLVVEGRKGWRLTAQLIIQFKSRDREQISLAVLHHDETKHRPPRSACRA